MLTADYLDRVPDDVVELYAELEILIIQDISRRISKMNYLTPTAEFQFKQLIEAGKVYENAIKQIALITGKSEKEVRATFESSSLKSLRFDDSIAINAGLQPIPLAKSVAMIQIINANILKTNNNLKNLTMTTASTSQQLFIQSSTLAQMQIQSGAFPADIAIRNAVKNASTEGLRVIYLTGESRTIESAVRANVLTGVNQTAAKLTEMRAQELGFKHYETSAHSGAREGEGYKGHVNWQGERFLINGSDKKYRNFKEATGYGLIQGLCGTNCRHSFYSVPESAPLAYTQSILKSLDKPDVKYKGKTYSYYEATQKQRYIERNIRKWKLESKAMESAGVDNSIANAKVKEWQKKAREFTIATGVKRDYTREQIA